MSVLQTLCGWIGAMLLLTPLLASSQSIPVKRLAPPSARLAEELFGISTGRELADGRFLIGEGSQTSRRLLVVDFQRGTTQQIGRRGQGPGEYRLVSRLFPLASDSTLIVADNMRWLVLSGAVVSPISSGTRFRRNAELIGTLVVPRAYDVLDLAEGEALLALQEKQTEVLRVKLRSR